MRKFIELVLYEKIELTSTLVTSGKNNQSGPDELPGIGVIALLTLFAPMLEKANGETRQI